MSGQTLNDRLTAARHTLAGQGLARVVCKATTEEAIGPKKKHLDYLLHCTNEPNVSIPQLANLLIERTQHSSWVVVFKALVTVHHLMCYGNERFTQYLASSNCTFQLSNFLDKSGVQGYDMSTYIRRYAKYLNEKAITYRTVAFDFCKVKRGKEDGILRTMNTDKLLKTLPILQLQLDALLEFDCTSNDLSNGVISCCFMLLFRDLIRLFACYNDGIINLLEKYFDMNKKNCREALDIYKKFLIRMDRVAELLKVAENVGIDKGDIPDLTKAPGSLLDALEQHLASLEGKKGAVDASAAAASASGNGLTSEMNGGKVDESLRRAVEEEAAVMNQLKSDRESPLLWEQPAWNLDPERRNKDGRSSPDGTGSIVSPPSGSTKTNPFLASPSAEPAIPSTNQGIIDLFSSPPATTTAPSNNEASDLLCMGNNPFADSLFGNSTQSTTAQTPFVSFGTNGCNATTPSGPGSFVSDASFAAAFGSGNQSTAGPGLTTTVIPSASTEKGTGSGLTLPVLEPYMGRSASPSPTAELMQGAGTTPILAQPSEPGFGEMTESIEENAPPAASTGGESSDFIWGGKTSSPVSGAAPVSAPVEPNPFGAPFEPSASVSPETAAAAASAIWSEGGGSGVDLFNLEGPNFPDTEHPPTSAPSAPPPSPFGGLDVAMAQVGRSSTPDLKTHTHIPSQTSVGSTVHMQQKSAIDDLNVAIQKAMLKPSAQPSLGTISSPVLSSSLPPSGIMGPPPSLISQQPTPPVSIALTNTASTLASSSLTRLDSLAGSGSVGTTPTGRASSTPGYCGTPTSGMSSPAKSIAELGTTGTGFSNFGDVLQPLPVVSGAKVPGTTDVKTSHPATSSLIKGDLDSSLASLAQNLDINGPTQSLKRSAGHQWGAVRPGSQAKPVVTTTTWTPTGASASNIGGWGSPQHTFQPVGAVPNQWNSSGMMAGPFPQQPAAGIASQQPYGGMPGIRSMAPSGMGNVNMIPSMGMNVSTPQQMTQQTPLYGVQQQQHHPVRPNSTTSSINDPFGAL